MAEQEVGQSAVVEAAIRRIKDESRFFQGNEADIVRIFVRDHNNGFYDPAIPDSEGATVVTEMPFKYGRADIIVFHVDGSASVIEVKNGSNGYRHVVAGIGQASLYASQLAMTRGAVSKVRKCLMWTSTGDISLDAQIEEACEAANTIPMPLVHMHKLMAVPVIVREVMEAVDHD